MLEDSLIERMDAYRVLLLWQKEGTFIKESGLSPFAMELALGVCRRHLYLQYFIKSLTKKKPSLEVCTILEMGLFQMFFMEVPDHAAVSTSVELSKAANLQEGSARLVNAVLHAARRSGLPQLPPQRVRRVSVENSVPESLVRRWFDIYGADRAEALAKHEGSSPTYPPAVALHRTLVHTKDTDILTPTIQADLEKEGGTVNIYVHLQTRTRTRVCELKNRGTGKENVLHMHNGALLSHEKE